MDLLEVGKITNTHGLRGEVKVTPWTDSPDVFEELEYVYARLRGADTRLDVKHVKYQKNNIIVAFAQITSIEQAEQFKNSVLFAPKELLGSLPENVYYIADLVGCSVWDENGEIGTLSDVFTTGSNDIYDIKRNGNKNLLVPIIDGVVQSVDIENKRIVIKIPEGLEE